MYLIAILIPPLAFLIIGKFISAIICILLQITIIGWVPAAIWAVMSVNNYYAEKRTEKVLRALEQQTGISLEPQYSPQALEWTNVIYIAVLLGLAVAGVDYFFHSRP